MVETKVQAATAAAVLSSLVLWVLGEYVFGDVVPAPLEAAVVLVVTGVATWVAGYVARHTPRPDLPTAQR